ncbi:MAG: hypothetical protein BGN87_15925 [Rhizobiales bacterium 65-79]|nr:MAG: hypothetical protein BGN87_15925 [Rhizobiales bacterium 65-79]
MDEIIGNTCKSWKHSLFFSGELKLAFGCCNANPITKGFSRKQPVQIASRQFLAIGKKSRALQPFFNLVRNVDAAALASPIDKGRLHPAVPIGLAHTALTSGVSSEQDVVDYISVRLYTANELCGKGTGPTILQVSEEFLQFDSRRSLGIGQKLNASRAAIAVKDDISLSFRINQRRFVKASRFDNVASEFFHLGLVMREQPCNRSGLIFEFAVTIIRPVYIEPIKLDCLVAHPLAPFPKSRLSYLTTARGM